MSLTLITRETFQAVGTLDSGTPGNLGTVNAGSFTKRAVGPRVSSDTTASSKGWSADLRTEAGSLSKYHTMAVASTDAESKGIFSTWYFVSSLVAGTQGELGQSRQSNGNPLVFVKFFASTNGNFWLTRGGVWTNDDTSVAIPIRQWFELRHTWELVSGNTYNYHLAYRLAGSSTWVDILASGQYTFAGTINDVQGGNISGAGAPSSYITGRYGMPSLYSITSYSTDRTALISDVVDPATTAATWYVNPSTGSDTNDGTSASSAWQTVTKINAESKYCGLFPTSNGYANGDTLYINTSGANLVLGTSSIDIRTQGLNLVGANRVARVLDENLNVATAGTYDYIQAEKVIASNSWSATAGLTNVYESADTDTSAILWENDKWMQKLSGANLAAVQSDLDSTPGSFWTDGTKMYCHPFGSTNPSSDGKEYTRSYYRDTNSAILLQAADVHVDGLKVRKTAIADKATNDPGVNYGIQGQGSFGGTWLIENCYVDYASKHGIGFTDSNSNSTGTIRNCGVEQDIPYNISQTPYVSYNGGSSATGNRHYYINCTCFKDTGVVGSTEGTSGVAQAFYSHNNSGSNQFTLISLESCNFNNATTGGTNAVYEFTVNTSIFGGTQMGATLMTFTRSKMYRYVPWNERTDATITVRNCIFDISNYTPYTNDTGKMAGTAIIECNVFDLIDARAQDDTNPGLLTRVGATTLTFRNNAIVFPTAVGGSTTFSVFKNFVNTDTMTTDYNGIHLNGSVMSKSYNDGSSTSDRTQAQWQTLGKDTHSQFITITQMDFSPNYRPYHGSPLLNSGVNIGGSVDYSGRGYLVRNSIGAFEKSVKFSLSVARENSSVIANSGNRTTIIRSN